MVSFYSAVRRASKIYPSGDTTITALHPTDIHLNRGELVLLLGPSGSGKTTLLSLLGCVIYPTEGEVIINGQPTQGMNESALAALRLREIGFVFQSYNLVAPLTALENVQIPLQLLGVRSKEARKRAMAALEQVNMLERMKNLPKKLSGGQQQRVAIARALVTNPGLILCDEPTASLDPASVDIVMAQLKGLVSSDKTVVIVTHDMRLIPYADRIYEVNQGFVTEKPVSSYQSSTLIHHA